MDGKKMTTPYDPRARLEGQVKLLRDRLGGLEQRTVSDTQRPMHEVAVLHIRQQLTNYGQQLKHMDDTIYRRPA